MIKRVGVIGGGQLAWMMGAAAEKLQIELVIQTPSESDPAVGIASDRLLAAVDDASATAQMATQVEVVTFENEFVNLEALSLLANQGVCFYPRLQSLQPLLDKYEQRCYLRNLGLPSPAFFALAESHPPIEFPVVLKTRRHGYDGQGTWVIRSQADLEATLAQLGNRPLLVEEFVPFERELAAIAARSATGEMAIYPIVETQQVDQVCRRVLAPAAVSAAVAHTVEEIARTLLTSLEVVGVFGIELFLTGDGRVLVNEIAPRVHNSGHFTLDACATSQFEQHLRAVSGLPLGDAAMQVPAAVMVNLLGYEQATSDYQAKRQRLGAVPRAYLHWYGKRESRPGRKLGHVTVLLDNDSPMARQEIVREIEGIWYSQAGN